MADITRAEVASLIGEEYGPQVIKAATQGSTALAAFPQVCELLTIRPRTSS